MMRETLERDGRVWFRHGLDHVQISSLGRAADLTTAPGARLAVDAVDVSAVTQLAERLLPGARPVRIVAFNKSEGSNWTLPWHQDRVVALQDRIDLDGFVNWSRKAGTWHAEPPIALLDRMLFARVHLDSASTENGCLRIALGTHAMGKIASSDVELVAMTAPNEECVAERGDVLFAKALILHRSSSSQTLAPRRTIRIDYCGEALPAPLEWAA